MLKTIYFKCLIVQHHVCQCPKPGELRLAAILAGEAGEAGIGPGIAASLRSEQWQGIWGE